MDRSWPTPKIFPEPRPPPSWKPRASANEPILPKVRDIHLHYPLRLSQWRRWWWWLGWGVGCIGGVFVGRLSTNRKHARTDGT